MRYILKPPVGDTWSGNVIIVQKDGKVHRLARRVEPDQIESTLDAAEGVRDFDELQRRLEALLPAADVPAR